MSVIGRTAVVRHDGQLLVVNIIDAVPPTHRISKRVRVQSKGKLQGRVLMRGEYQLMEFCDR